MLAACAQLLLVCSFVGGIAIKLCVDNAYVPFDCADFIGVESDVQVAAWHAFLWVVAGVVTHVSPGATRMLCYALRCRWRRS